MGFPPDVNIEDLKEWLSWFGEIQSNIKLKKIKQDEVLKNIGGIKDVSTLEVSMKVARDFREKEFVEGVPVRVHYKGIPKTCFSCKQPGSRCPHGGSAGYLCKAKQGEMDLETVYEKGRIEER